MKTQSAAQLLGYREITEKDGANLEDIFYVKSFVRLWQHGELYQVTAQQSGCGRDYVSLIFRDLDNAQRAYDTVKGCIAHNREESK